MENDVRVQLAKAIEMKGNIERFAVLLDQSMKEVNEMLQEYVRAGFPVDIARTYDSRYLVPDTTEINTLSRDLATRHVEHLNGIITTLKETSELA